MNEPEYQQFLKKEIRKRLPDAIILKNDANWLQGFPDFTILYQDRYALLEIKRDKYAPVQPNQDYYISKADSWSVYSRFIFPENEKEVLDGLQRALASGR